MNAVRDHDGNTVVTMSAEEAHVLIWGGPVDVCGVLEQELRSTLVEIEDGQMSALEYRRRFDDLPSVYERLRTEFSKVSPQ